jgi:hypothetical protein
MIVVDYDKETGRISRVIRYPLDDYEVHYPGCLYFGDSFHPNDVRDYVKDGDVIPRPEMPAQLDGDWLRGVPKGAVITIEGQEYTADGSDIELDFEFHGTYPIRVSLWPYVDFEVIHEAHA